MCGRVSSAIHAWGPPLPPGAHRPLGDSTLRLPRRRTLKAELRRPVAARRRGCVGTASREGGGEEMRRLSQLHERNFWRIAETGAAIASLVSFFMGCFLWFQFDYTRPNGPNPLSHCQKGLSSSRSRRTRPRVRRRPGVLVLGRRLTLPL